MKVAFSGKMGSGKSTMAQAMVDRYSGFIHSFAAPFKAWVEDAWTKQRAEGVTRSNDLETIKATYPVFYRAVCQNIGQGCRDVDDDFWVNALLSQISDAEDYNAFVDDMRYPNEAEALRKAGFLLVRLEVPEAVRAERRMALTVDHASETSLDDYDAFDIKICASDGDFLSGSCIDAIADFYQSDAFRSTAAAKVIEYAAT